MLHQKKSSSFVLNGAPLQRAIPLDSPLEWKRALSGIRHSFFHTWEHCFAMQLTTGDPTFLYCAETPGVRVVCPFVERSYGNYVDIATPYGFSGFAGNAAFPNLPEIWHRFAVERGYISAYINLHPLFSRLDYVNTKAVYEQKILYALEPTRGIEELFRGFSESRRRGLRRWEESAVSIVTDREDLRRFFLDNYRQFFRRKNASPVYDFDPKTMEFLLSLDNVLVVGAGKGGLLEAVHVFAYTQYAAEYLFNVSLPERQLHGAGLVCEAVKQLQRLGIPVFNLGGGLVPGDNLTEFKRRFGAAPLPLYAVKEVFAADAYSEMCLRLGVDPGDRTGYFPSYRSSRPH